MSVSLDRVSLVHPNACRAVNGVSLNIGAGERVAVIGPSGAGKTTLLRLIASALRPTTGAMQVLGFDPWRLDRARLRGLRARDRKSTRLNSSHIQKSRMPSSA